MEETLLEIYGFKLRPKTLYEITEKLDSSAPDGFIEFKTSKVLDAAIQDSVPGAIYDRDLGAWDTGLFENSRALREAIPTFEERAKFVKDAKKIIVDPLQKIKGKNYLAETDPKLANEFWDNYRIKVGKGIVLNTERPEDLLKLFLAIIHKQVTPKPLESHPSFKNSQFCIIDKEDSIDRTLEKDMGIMEAQSTFYTLLTSKRPDLILILDYLKMGVTTGTDDKVLASQFMKWLKDKTDGYQNYSVFLKAHKYFLTEEGEKEVYYTSKIKELLKKGIVKQKKNEIWFEDEYIGSDIKSTVKNILQNKDLEARFLKHLE